MSEHLSSHTTPAHATSTNEPAGEHDAREAILAGMRGRWPGQPVGAIADAILANLHAGGHLHPPVPTPAPEAHSPLAALTRIEDDNYGPYDMDRYLDDMRIVRAALTTSEAAAPSVDVDGLVITLMRLSTHPGLPLEGSDDREDLKAAAKLLRTLPGSRDR